MKRLEVLQTIKKLMMEYNISAQDLVEMTNEDGTYPFEVLYTDGTRSNVPVKGKEIWGVISGKGAICLTESPKKMNLQKARQYCRGKNVGGKVCTAGSDEFWKEVMELDSKVDLLNAFILSLGGNALEENYWTDTVINTERGQSGCYIGFSSYYDWVFMWTSHKFERQNKARPVCPL